MNTHDTHLNTLGYTPRYLTKLREGFPRPETEREKEFYGLYQQQLNRACSAERKLEQHYVNSARLTAETIKRTTLQREVTSLKETAEAWKWWGRFHRKSAAIAWIVALVLWVLWAVGK